MEKGCRNAHPFLFPTTLMHWGVPPPRYVEVFTGLVSTLTHRVGTTHARVMNEITTASTATIIFSSPP